MSSFSDNLKASQSASDNKWVTLNIKNGFNLIFRSSWSVPLVNWLCWNIRLPWKCLEKPPSGVVNVKCSGRNWSCERLWRCIERLVTLWYSFRNLVIFQIVGETSTLFRLTRGLIPNVHLETSSVLVSLQPQEQQHWHVSYWGRFSRPVLLYCRRSHEFIIGAKVQKA